MIFNDENWGLCLILFYMHSILFCLSVENCTHCLFISFPAVVLLHCLVIQILSTTFCPGLLLQWYSYTFGHSYLLTTSSSNLLSCLPQLCKLSSTNLILMSAPLKTFKFSQWSLSPLENLVWCPDISSRPNPANFWQTLWTHLCQQPLLTTRCWL